MKTIKKIELLRSEVCSWAGQSIALVPTMGFLHDGHISLVEKAKQVSDRVVVSIYVNPTQFGQNEDLDSYPQDIQGDTAKLEAAGVDVLFTPEHSDVYLQDHQTWVQPGALASGLCGVNRPGHFRGVATVVLKLLNIVSPSKLFLGKKDYQQYLMLKRMVLDLSLSVDVVGVETKREVDGLAMSSRNLYLDSISREKAPLIRLKLLEIGSAIESKNEELILKTLHNSKDFMIENGFKMDYLSICDGNTLQPVYSDFNRPLVVLCAAKLGSTRLIDNLECL